MSHRLGLSVGPDEISEFALKLAQRVDQSRVRAISAVIPAELLLECFHDRFSYACNDF